METILRLENDKILIYGKTKKKPNGFFFYASLLAFLASRLSFNSSMILPPNQ